MNSTFKFREHVWRELALVGCFFARFLLLLDVAVWSWGISGVLIVNVGTGHNRTKAQRTTVLNGN